MKDINIVVTMDCEPTTATSNLGATGPAEWPLGERAVMGYAEIARKYGFPVTYFIHPETALAQAPMFNDLAKQGACLGLHMHPWKYSTWRYQRQRYFAHYGALSEHEQRALLSEASALWHEGIGYRPQYFRPGTFSANDSIFRVLSELSFRGGSCSSPGRVVAEMQAIWVGAEPDPHRAHAHFRQSRGDLDFADVPLSADFSALLTGRLGRKMYADLRPDVDWPAEYGVSWKTIATNIVNQVKERDPAVPTIVIVTHNHYEFRDEGNAVTQRLRSMFDALCAACSAADVRPSGATLSKVVDDVLAIPHVPAPMNLEGGIFQKVK